MGPSGQTHAGELIRAQVPIAQEYQNHDEESGEGHDEESQDRVLSWPLDDQAAAGAGPRGIVRAPQAPHMDPIRIELRPP